MVLYYRNNMLYHKIRESEALAMTGPDILHFLEEEYFDKILGFCCLKMNTREEAEDLAQDIAFELLKVVRNGQRIDNLGAFIWRVSNNIFLKRLRDKKYGGTVYLPDGIPSHDHTEEEIIRREQESLLRREIALLSENYRKAVVMYYFDGKSTAEIAGELRKSTGTVKWWLHDARNLLKEGIHTMREFGERSFKPENLVMSCQFSPGADGEPMSCVKRKSTQNILLAAYKQPLTIEELCVELGIAAPYIEDEVQYLVENQLMREVPGGRYQTDFVILPPPPCSIDDRIVEQCFPGFADDLMNLLEEHRALLTSPECNPVGFAWERLLWVYIHMFADFMILKYKLEECGVITGPDIPDRPNGGKWIALGFAEFREKPERNYHSYEMWDGPVHKPNEYVQGFYHWWSGMNSRVFFDLPEGVFSLCNDIIAGKYSVDSLNDDQKYLFSIAVEKKLFLRCEDETFRPNYYYCAYDRLCELESIANEVYAQFKHYFDTAYTIIKNTLVPDVPKHLLKQAANRLSNSLHIFITRSLYEAEQQGLLSTPDENNRDWLSLFATEA